MLTRDEFERRRRNDVDFGDSYDDYAHYVRVEQSFAPANYRLDDAMLDHLNTWCERELRDDERDDVREKMIAYLQSGTPEDAEYSLNHGWTHIRDLVTA